MCLLCDTVLCSSFLSAPLLAKLKTQGEQQDQKQNKADYSKCDQAVCHREAVVHFCFLELGDQGTITVNWPGTLMEITPPHMHISLELLFSAGRLPSNTVGARGRQGAMVMGIQGIGVRAPSAAAVAAAVSGDTVLIAGKGHEDYQEIGSERRQFDDAEVARACLGART